MRALNMLETNGDNHGHYYITVEIKATVHTVAKQSKRGVCELIQMILLQWRERQTGERDYPFPLA